jgi:2-C-methyl-D-erythritol 4-phosphate cytidylyltransferase
MLQGKRVTAVVPAAGKGRRMERGTAKQFLEVGGRPILALTLGRLAGMPEIDELLVAAAEDQIPLVRGLVGDHGIGKVRDIVPGGNERQDSVWNCLRRLREEESDLVLVHDGVRPWVTRELVARVCAAAIEHGSAIPVLPPKETIKTVDRDGFVGATLAREGLAVVQTPQAFRFSVLFHSYEMAMRERFYGTDDASLVERFGGKVKVVEGIPGNIKITTPEDLAAARQMTH